MNILIANFANDSVALIQWCIENNLPDVHVVSVDTGWAACGWDKRVAKIKAIAEQAGFTWARLHSQASFAECVTERQAFPTKKFQWCAGILKGLPINDYLDTIDPMQTATVLLAKRQQASRANFYLSEKIHSSEHYLGRTVWHPLFYHSESERNALIENTGLAVLSHRSLECQPCVHSTTCDLSTMTHEDKNKLAMLEEKLGMKMFSDEHLKSIGKQSQKSYNEYIDMGCGSPWGCGE